MANRECPKGFILVPSESDGEYVPFFMQVRDKDIIWDEGSIPNNISNIAKKDCEESELIYPMYAYSAYEDGWSVMLYPNKYYEATKTFNLQKSCRFISQNIMEVIIKLPFPTINEANQPINLQIQKVTTKNLDTTFLTATNTLCYPENVSIESCSCMLYATASPWASDYTTNSKYNNQRITVSVKGFIKL